MSRLADILGALSVAADARALKRNNAAQLIMSAYDLVPKFKHRRRSMRVSTRWNTVTDAWERVWKGIRIATPAGLMDVLADPDCPRDRAYALGSSEPPGRHALGFRVDEAQDDIAQTIVEVTTAMWERGRQPDLVYMSPTVHAALIRQTERYARRTS